MRSVLFALCVLILALLLINPSDGGEVLRLRVIANSDSISDQYEKMRVVNALDRLFESQSFETLEAAELWISDNMDKIEDTCADVWKNDFEAELRGERYDDGEYRSLVITLGEGRGHNFWGTLFPDISQRMAGAKASKIKPFRVISRDGSVVEVRFFTIEKILNIF